MQLSSPDGSANLQGDSRKTYTNLDWSPVAFVSKALSLYRHHTRDIVGSAAATARTARAFEDRVRDATGSGLKGKKVLIVGTGQTLRELYSFSTLGADVTGIDLDVVPLGFDPLGYARLWRKNGFGRLAKTAGRRILGIDRRFERELARELGAARLARGRLLAMDASKMTFSNEHFDAVYSFSVFEHLSDPAAVSEEMVRVLKPGGTLLVSTHIFSAVDGNHDLRLFTGERGAIPYWAHLRSEHRHTTREDCYVNRWTLPQWDALYASAFPGCRSEDIGHHASFDRELKEELARLRVRGDLPGYSDRDLLTVNAVAHWRKPSSTSAPAPRSAPAHATER